MLKNQFLFILAIVCLLSCNPDDSEQRGYDVDTARYYLTQGNCDAAINLLLSTKIDTSDYDYVRTLSSAYACRAGFSELTLLESDVANLDATDETTIIGSFVKFSTSPETTVDSSNYSDLLEAINTILYAGSVSNPSVANRVSVFGSSHANNLNLQLIYMYLALFGKYFYYYGDSDSNGVKAAGSNSNNTCLFSYTDAASVAFVTTQATGSCVSGGDGHPEMANADPALGGYEPEDLRRMCEGYIMLTNLLDLIANTTFPSSDELGDMNSIKTNVVDNIYGAGGYCDDPSLPAGICDERRQSECESTYSNAANFPDLERFYAVIFEQMFI